MSTHDSTRWTVIRDAALGVPTARDEFARRYESVIRAYIETRWRARGPSLDVDDAVQDVFLDCLRPDGALGRADSAAPGGFHAFLYGVTRNVARRIEKTRRDERARSGGEAHDPDDLEARGPSASARFDRAWAESLMAQAASLQEERAAAAGPEPMLRLELLRMRFHEGLPIREIARRRHVPAPQVHHDYAVAREEFRAALADVVRMHQDGNEAEIRAACSRLLEHLD